MAGILLELKQLGVYFNHLSVSFFETDSDTPSVGTSELVVPDQDKLFGICVHVSIEILARLGQLKLDGKVPWR